MKCIRCNENDKVGYKYCGPCRLIVKKEKDFINQKKRRGNKTLCLECKKEYTTTKYCKRCSPLVIARKAKERRLGKVSHKVETRGRKPKVRDKDIKIDIFWLVRGLQSMNTRADSISVEA